MTAAAQYPEDWPKPWSGPGAPSTTVLDGDHVADASVADVFPETPDGGGSADVAAPGQACESVDSVPATPRSPHHRRRVRVRPTLSSTDSTEASTVGGPATFKAGSKPGSGADRTRQRRQTGTGQTGTTPKGSDSQYGFPFSTGQRDPYATDPARGRRPRGRTTPHDVDLLAATITGRPTRIDDATDPHVGPHRPLGTLQNSRSCYVCKTRYREVYSFYHALCPACAATNYERRTAHTDLTGRRALLTGGRAKIGKEIALRLLRDGADVTITTRFPTDTADRFTTLEDYDDWSSRLRVVGIDLRQIDQVVRLSHQIADEGQLDILINNAAQTVRRSRRAYQPLMDREALGELPGAHRTVVLTNILDGAGATIPRLTSSTPELHWTASDEGCGQMAVPVDTRDPATTALEARGACPVDAGGLIPDADPTNSWSKRIDEVDPIEMLEVQLINVTAPFVLIGSLREAMRAAASPRRYVVNVSAMEGQFGRHYKNPTHPHTNMAKASLNMLTRTSAPDYRRDGIYMNSVDTGWITDERPFNQRAHEATLGFRAPLDLADGAARVYDPIVRGELGEDIFGCFLKDYTPSAW